MSPKTVIGVLRNALGATLAVLAAEIMRGLVSSAATVGPPATLRIIAAVLVASAPIASSELDLGLVTAVLNTTPRGRPLLVLPGRQWLPAAVA